MRFLVVLFCLFIIVCHVFADTVKICITKLPKNHPQQEAIFIVGDFNDWNPNDPNFKMTINQDNSYTIDIHGTGTIHYKFTRGSWSNVEKGDSCEEVGNSEYTFGSDGVVDHQILNWGDLCGNLHTAQENVTVIKNDFFMPQLNRNRRVWIYLPPNYLTTKDSYPVIYMHDGQNLFDDYFSFSGEWGVDETLNKLFGAGDHGCIVVGIDNGGNYRLKEYSPWINSNYGGGEGDLYADFIINTLKPYIDKHYRTLSDRNNTAMIGSSLGAFISFYIGLKNQNIFSKMGIFSPSFWFSDSCYTFARNTLKQEKLKIYFLAGGQERGVVDQCKSMIDTLIESGFSVEELKMKAVETGTHSESFWKQEFSGAYQWLFSK